ncbi:MAG: hypothetical protein H7X89_05620 [Rhizobiales bacterium]|nr:hypothetical protein [Hyphomicrobiales bacterium]
MTAVGQSENRATSVFRIIWLSVVAPRQAVRGLASLADVRQACLAIVALSVVAVTAASAVASWVELKDQIDPNQFTFFVPGQAIAETAAWGGIEVVFGIVFFPQTILIWKYLFGFKGNSRAVWVATAACYALMVFIDPIVTFIPLLASDAAKESAEWIALTGYFVVATGFGSFYYSEALAIPLLKSALLNVAVLAIVLIGVILLMVLGFAVLENNGAAL